MDSASYVALSRQTGLARQMDVVANNLANMSTTGYQREGVTFAEIVRALKAEGGSVALTHAHARHVIQDQGGLKQTGGQLDLAIEGPGYFAVETPDGPRLTRAGAFGQNADGEVVTPAGHRLLDAGGAPLFLPGNAGTIAIGGDGTVTADGAPIAQIGLQLVDSPEALERAGDTLFRAVGATRPAEDAQILQGFLESSNVNPVTELTRMIETQRAYEANQRLIDREDDRIKKVIETATRRS